MSKPTDFPMKKQIIMFIELIAAKGCYETFWGILSVLYAPFTNMSGFFSFIYKMFLKRIRATTITTTLPITEGLDARCQAGQLAWGKWMTLLRSHCWLHFIHRRQKVREMRQLVQCHPPTVRQPGPSSNLVPFGHADTWDPCGGVHDIAKRQTYLGHLQARNRV